MRIEPRQKIVFIGDSITDAGRRDVAVPYGNGYVSMVRQMLIARHPSYDLNLLNRGINGNTVRDLAGRWDRDVIAERPDWVTIMVGINDVWRQFFGDPATAVFPVEYEATLKLLAHRAIDGGASVILMSPYMIETNRNLPIVQQMTIYGHIMKRVAGEVGALYVDIQAAWNAALKVTVPTFWSNDNFHPYGPGHALIAREWLRAIAFTL
jgi:lysophospholipase L1-like esterase